MVWGWVAPPCPKDLDIGTEKFPNTCNYQPPHPTTISDTNTPGKEMNKQPGEVGTKTAGEHSAQPSCKVCKLQSPKRDVCVFGRDRQLLTRNPVLAVKLLLSAQMLPKKSVCELQLSCTMKQLPGE